MLALRGGAVTGGKAVDIKRSHTVLYRFFSGLAEYTFEARLGVADPPLVDYIALLLTRFVHSDAIYKVRNPAGRRLEEVAAMLLEAEARIGNPRREVHRHIGDFTLFWTGVYPEALRRLKTATRLDYFIDYCEQGKRAYHIAATIETEKAEENEVLERLSHDFELCAYGLGEVRREWERRDPEASLPGQILL
jgi:hypothetical protein